ncbi:MAG: hypothetical protein DME26_03575, partial [Verrucomicrobia bacterium]
MRDLAELFCAPTAAELERGIYAASSASCQRTLKRHKCRVPKSGSWAGSTVLCSRMGTMNRRVGGPGLQIVGRVPSRGSSWRVARSRFWRRVVTMNGFPGGRRSTAALACRWKNGLRWNATLPTSWAIIVTTKARYRAPEASILVGLLWCLAILSVVVIGVLHTARLDLLVAKNYGDTIQAHYLALAGIEKAKSLLYLDAMTRKRSGKNHTGELYDAPEYFREVALGRGQFRVFRQGRRDEGGKIIYGVTDEESRLNLNHAQADELAKLYGMTPEVVAAILDWRDVDNAVTPGGAEAEYYASLQPPYRPRNGPL